MNASGKYSRMYQCSYSFLAEIETTKTNLDGLLFFPFWQKVRCLALNDFVFWDDFHLQACNLGLDWAIFSFKDVIEGSPLAINVVAVQPVRWELEALPFQYALAFLVQLQ